MRAELGSAGGTRPRTDLGGRLGSAPGAGVSGGAGGAIAEGALWWEKGLHFRFQPKFRCAPKPVYRSDFHGLPVISTGKGRQNQNFGISEYRPKFRCIIPVYQCFSPKNDGNGWKMSGKLCIYEKN